MGFRAQFFFSVSIECCLAQVIFNKTLIIRFFKERIMSLTRVPMTVEGAKKLQEELDFLKSVERPRIIAAIAEAREHGDLKENAEYHAAREQQGFAEGRIQEIESKLSLAQVIDISKIVNNGKVIFASTVTIVNVETDETSVFKIVGQDEANIKENRISVGSPIARGLIGKEAGDTVKIQTPKGLVEYEIDQVEYL